MPKVKINKQLSRPDGGNVSSGSLAVCNNPQQRVSSKQVIFKTSFYITESAYDNGKQPIPKLDKFPRMKLVKDCSDEEWDALYDDAGAGALVGTFMTECIDAILGDGFTELIE
jgi:hypothetical protein